jgi:uncharacterized protein (DUF433 family)
MRLSVRRVLEALGTYASREELRADYPELEDEDIRQALVLRCTPTGAVRSIQDGTARE